MGIVDTFLICVGLSMDAFAVSVCKGLGSRSINWKRAFLTALSFGLFQAVMPLIGWCLGSSILFLIEPVDHWIAFALLAGLGVKMIWDAFHEEDGCKEEDAGSARFFSELLALSVATSIDALVAGISFAMTSVNIWAVIILIGATTFALSLAGTVIGNRFGAKFERAATILGGCALILLGIKVLIDHLS